VNTAPSARAAADYRLIDQLVVIYPGANPFCEYFESISISRT